MRVNAFRRLRTLIEGVSPPAGKKSYMLHLGESKLLDDQSPFILECSQNGWNHYPALGGDEKLRDAYFSYLESKYGLTSKIAGLRGVEIECAPGSKQALSLMIMLSIENKRRDHGSPPVIVLPDPCYPAYVDAALFWDCKIEYYSTLPGAMVCNLLTLTDRYRSQLAAVVICNPGNPYGNCLSESELQEVIDNVTSLIIFDECYIDLYHNKKTIGPLTGVASGLISSENIVVSHTLSKRNCMPGLRSSFLCGGKYWISLWASFNRACGVSLAEPICHASAQLWLDNDKVKVHREILSKNIGLFSEFFPNIPLPDAGFFVCIKVKDDLLSTKLLWEEEGILAMPGTYLINDPVHLISFIRIALVYPEQEMQDIFTRMKFFFTHHPFLL